jgi:hypothetical protein
MRDSSVRYKAKPKRMEQNPPRVENNHNRANRIGWFLLCAGKPCLGELDAFHSDFNFQQLVVFGAWKRLSFDFPINYRQRCVD